MLIQVLFLLIICFHSVQMDNDFESGYISFRRKHFTLSHIYTGARCKRQITQSTGCILTPQATEGPYYWNATIRQNITFVFYFIQSSGLR
jgi:hypothetical protein